MPKTQKIVVADNQQGHALCYLLGVYFGDGCVTLRRTNKDGTENRCFTMTVVDKDFRDHVAEQFAVTFPEHKPYLFDYNRPGRDRTQYSVRVGLVGPWFESMTGKRMSIPAMVYASRESRKAFLEGLMDSEGWVSDTTHLNKGYIYLQVGVGLTCDLTSEFKRLFEACGIRTGKMHNRVLPNGKVMHQIHLNSADWMASDFGFHCWRKQRKVEAHRLARQLIQDAKHLDKASFNEYKRTLIAQLKAA